MERDLGVAVRERVGGWGLAESTLLLRVLVEWVLDEASVEEDAEMATVRAGRLSLVLIRKARLYGPNLQNPPCLSGRKRFLSS